MKCIAVDDEPLALKQIETYIKGVPFLELIKTCRSAKEAFEALNVVHIDVMFIDVNMPDINGVDFVKSLQEALMVIFTTAYANYAIDGFKLDAVDYLLKPFTKMDFMKACSKAYTLYELRQKASAYVPSEFMQGSPNAVSISDFIYVKSDYKVVRININDIIYIESMSEYVRIFLESSKKAVVTLLSMNKLEEELEPKGFMRVHRSYIVNLDKVNMVSRMRIVFDNTNFIPVGDMYKDKFTNYINSHFLVKN